MNAVEIEEAISAVAEQSFDPDEFPYAFLRAFDNKDATIRRLRSGESNKSDVGGVLQTNNIHIAACTPGKVSEMLSAMRASPATLKAKAKFVVATDGITFEAEDLISGEVITCEYEKFPDHFGFFLPLAGISTVKQIRDSSFDVRATGRLNRLYLELRKDNPGWDTAENRPAMNHFLARLIFCFFAENTDIFGGVRRFTSTIEQLSERDSSNTDEIIREIFRAMNVKDGERQNARLPRWANSFPYVNGGLFSGPIEVPRFSRVARSYLLHIGSLEWIKINPDIFGSMIQAVADDEERGSLGMHYTSVPNILAVLNPLFLDEIRQRLAEAEGNPRMLLNLRRRLSRIRVFDPACGSGNFLVIAYKELRAIEAEINRQRGEADRRSDIRLTNFRGIELRHFPAEIARLALIIAEFQSDVIHRGQKEALADFLPLDAENWITRGNALRLDWLSICPPSGTTVKPRGEDLLPVPDANPQVDFENEGGETYICGNPPYLGASLQSDEQKEDLASIFDVHTKNWKVLDYVSAWFMKAVQYAKYSNTSIAFVSTNSICQGQQVPTLWPLIFKTGAFIRFAYTSFKWANLASHNAGVTVVIVGISSRPQKTRHLFAPSGAGEFTRKDVDNINPYLVAAENIYVNAASKPLNGLPPMDYGSKPADGGGLILTLDEKRRLEQVVEARKFIVPYVGSTEFIDGKQRYCLWIEEAELGSAMAVPQIKERVDLVRAFRLSSKKKPTNDAAAKAYSFAEVRYGRNSRTSIPFIVPIHTGENRGYLPVGFLQPGSVISNAAFAMYDAPIWCISLIASKLHLAWIATVCGKIKTDYRYSNTLGWNTFPVPTLTEKMLFDLAKSAENILIAREEHFPASIADLYEVDKMPSKLREAHEHNDEVLERIYIGRRFRNDTERLEKLFSMYVKMTELRNKLA